MSVLTVLTFSGLCCAPNQTQLTVFRERSSAQAAAASKVEIYNANTLAAVWVSQDKPAPARPCPHTWSPLASLSGPHCSLMTVAILIPDTWSRGKVAVNLHYTVFVIRSQWWAGHNPQQFACDVAMPGARAVKVVTTAGLGLGPCLARVLHHINTDNNQHCQNCDHVYTPGVQEYMTWGQQWSVYKRCGVLEKAVMWCVTAWQCRQFLRRKMWRFMCYVEALQ